MIYLVLWLVFALLVQWLNLSWLLALCLPLVVAALVCARARSVALLRRSRWLFLAICVLFIFGTPGVYAPGVFGQMGITVDGVALAAEHILRLLCLLLTLAMLHEKLGTAGLLAGLYRLCAPLPEHWRQRMVVRLALVIAYAEEKKVGWREMLASEDDGQPSCLTLPLDAPPRYANEAKVKGLS